MTENNNVNKPMVFIEQDWITGDTCVFTISNPFDRAKVKAGLCAMRKKLIARLIDEGFEITTDRGELPEDTIYLIMNSSSLCDENADLDVFKKAFDQRIFQAGGEKLNYPRSLSMDDYFANPFLPAVLKNESTNAGKDKFLIETTEQLKKVFKFYSKYKTVSPYKEAFSCTIFQQFIDTPTNHNTYMRVLMSASGDVMGASLKYSMGVKENRPAMGVLEKHFWDPNSEYYLNCQGMFGYYSGGGNISFAQPRYSTEKQTILQAQGLDPNKPTVPTEVVEVSDEIMSKCNKELGIICGIDFIQDKNDGKWYYLENQAFPAIDEWAEPNGYRIPTRGGIDNYVKYNELDVEARYTSLMMLVNKRKNNLNSTNLGLK